jgi:hypothetical protein
MNLFFEGTVLAEKFDMFTDEDTSAVFEKCTNFEFIEDEPENGFTVKFV